MEEDQAAQGNEGDDREPQQRPYDRGEKVDSADRLTGGYGGEPEEAEQADEGS